MVTTGDYCNRCPNMSYSAGIPLTVNHSCYYLPLVDSYFLAGNYSLFDSYC